MEIPLKSFDENPFFNVVSFWSLPAQLSLWCVPFFPLTYLALSVPAPQADGNMAPWLREPPLFCSWSSKNDGN